MGRYKLAPSLDNLFNEIDARWPSRAHRVDGWYNPNRVSYGHNAKERGLVHAIDVDKNGVNPAWIIEHIYRNTNVLWYIIWARHLWSNNRGWQPYYYDGPNPHYDHLHIEIRHTVHAEQYSGAWRIGPSGISKGAAHGFKANYEGRDYRGYLVNTGDKLHDAGGSAHYYRGRLRNLRG